MGPTERCAAPRNSEAAGGAPDTRGSQEEDRGPPESEGLDRQAPCQLILKLVWNLHKPASY